MNVQDVLRCPPGQCESTESLFERTGRGEGLPFVPPCTCHYCGQPVCLDCQRAPVSEPGEICGVCPEGAEADAEMAEDRVDDDFDPA
jgi:hypothetical protein